MRRIPRWELAAACSCGLQLIVIGVGARTTFVIQLLCGAHAESNACGHSAVASTVYIRSGVFLVWRR